MYEEDEHKLIVEQMSGNLPTLPVLMNELMKTLGNQHAAISAVSDIIKIDQAVSSRLLQGANKFEVRKGSADRICEIGEAIQKLGFIRVKDITLATSVLKMLEDARSDKQFDPRGLWLHSVAVAIGSQVIAEYVEFAKADHAYTCGLLHDIGKVAKFQYDPKFFAKHVRSAARKGIDLYELEKSRKLTRHDLLGHMICKEWEVSPMTEEIALWHHVEDRSERRDVEDPYIHKLIDIVCLANKMVHKIDVGDSGHKVYREPSQKFLKRMQLSEDDLEQIEGMMSEGIQSNPMAFELLSESSTEQD